MTLKNTFYWTARFLFLTLLAMIIFYSGTVLALIIVRTLPFVAPFLRSQESIISTAQGAQFINTVYPVSSQAVPLTQRLKIDPIMPLAIGISLIRKIKPIDGLIRRFTPGVNNRTYPNSENSMFDLDIPSVSSTSEALQGIAPGDSRALQQVKGQFLNLGLGLLFLLLLLFCIIVAVSIFKSLVVSFNNRSKQLVYDTAQLSDELRSLPSALQEIQKGKMTVKKKTSTKKKNT